MDSLTLLETARNASLDVRADGGKLVIRGPKSAESVVRQLMNRKPQVLLLLQDDVGTSYPLTVVWPVGVLGICVILGRWRQLETGEVEATYATREEYTIALILVLEARLRALQERLEKGLQVIGDHRGTDEELQGLHNRFRELLDEHQDTLQDLRAIKAIVVGLFGCECTKDPSYTD